MHWHDQTEKPHNGQRISRAATTKKSPSPENYLRMLCPRH
jgi:hypothetical protein